jgi:chloride channel protein, CIC family
MSDIERLPSEANLLGPQVLRVSALAIVVALAAGVIAQGLVHLIGLVTNLAFYGKWSFAFTSPANHSLGLLVLGVPVVGGLLVGVMARYGSPAIRGHGIPEAMEQVLLNQSRIPPRLVILKPVSAAIAIGTGGPFGAEGPIIATGGALGSLLGQFIQCTAAERKILLAAGAAAGMAATFGSPVSAVLLAVELLLFEFRARSIVPVSLAAATAAAVRIALVGSAPVFAMPDVTEPSSGALAFYVVLGAFMGFAAVGVTKAVYAIEDAFARIPIHWMWWPALGGLVVGAVGYIAPRTLGVGYDLIGDVLSGSVATNLLLSICLLKFVSWSVSLGSGTSGGTLAPLFIIGGTLGAAVSALARLALPQVGIDPRVAALVGMAGLFAGASHAVLASVVFAFETTRQPLGLLPLLAGCTASYLISALLMKSNIMTEKIARRGVRISTGYAADLLETTLVRDAATSQVVSLQANRTVADFRDWLMSGSPGSEHRGFPVVDEDGRLRGLIMRRTLLAPGTPADSTIAELLPQTPIVIQDDASLREAAQIMAHGKVGRLPVVSRQDSRKLLGILSRTDVIAAYRRLREEEHPQEGFHRSVWSFFGRS